MRKPLPLEENLDILTDVDTVDKQTAEELLDEYDSPGNLFTYLHYEFSVNNYDTDSNEIDVDIELPDHVDPLELYQNMSRAGIHYYTGIQEVRPEPPDGYVYQEVDGTRTEYTLIGREEENGYCHFYRATDDVLEILVFEQDYDGNLDRQDLTRFRHSHSSRLQHYIDKLDWELLREPDYQELYEQLVDEPDDVVERGEFDVEPGQSNWNDWEL